MIAKALALCQPVSATLILQMPLCCRGSASLLAAQVSDDANVMLNGFGTVVNSLKMRAKPYLPQICGTIKWRLNNKSAKIRQQAADLIARIAVVMKVRFRVWHMQRSTWSQQHISPHL